MADHSDSRPPIPDSREDSQPPTSDSLAHALTSGKYRALAQAVSLVERDDGRAERLLADIYPATGRARIIGITGS
ncbi:MAG TPA: hypothetical protein VNN25_04480, partial [Thermoanaerobaculia bacterium]|nr:hypothetical protein [Thermoanaerobaculia bacterium]